MNIQYSHISIAQICNGTILQEGITEQVHHIFYDSRKISFGTNGLFACLQTENHNGHAYIQDAYEKGVRTFLIDQEVDFRLFAEATILQVPNVLIALQNWATFHRLQYNIPVIGITGSSGKTIVKEWLYHLLCDNFRISRSPKSFNSQLGVALSLFEINDTTEIAIIEAGISEKGEMAPIERMIQPTLGVFTSFLSSHRENFRTVEEHFSEKLLLFVNCDKVFVSSDLRDYNFHHLPIVFSDTAATYSARNKALVELVAKHFGLSEETIQEKSNRLPQIALRMETIEGINNNTLLVDAYNASFDGLEQALAHQISFSANTKRFLFLSEEAHEQFNARQFTNLLKRFQLVECNLHLMKVLVFGSSDTANLESISESTLLFKGSQPEIKRLVSKLKARKHATQIEISLSALKHNLKVWRNRLSPKTKLMAMVKASSYGSELTKIGQILTHQNIQYLGVAYVNEGVELRKNGIQLPIMVMNSDASNWSDCITYQLEPSLFSFGQMEDLVRELILLDIQNFPVHLKFDTGMHRLGFLQDEQLKVLEFIQNQPELKICSIYSHLADADNLQNQDFTHKQLKTFQVIAEFFQKKLPYPILRHILNTEGLSNFPEYCFDMVRVGIGLYGISSNAAVKANLEPVLSWKSQISQIKTIQSGESIGYSMAFVANQTTTYAVIPVGYADGYKRLLSNGVGRVFIQSHACPVLGKVCMDMIMVDITGLQCIEGEEVEIIGKNQTVEDLAKQCQTIPYEIMTSLSQRMPRIFVEEQD